MKRETKLHLMGILILVFCVSCGQSVKETIKPVVPTPASGQFTKVVILPFADHTQRSSLYDHCQRNVLVLEALQDALYQAGFISAAEEDVVRYLFDQDIIQGIYNDSDSAGTSSVQREMQENWSDAMKEELGVVMSQNIDRDRFRGGRETIALDTQKLKELGNVFGADYVVRGRIIEFRSDQKDSFNPLRTGVIPFVFKSGQRTIFGVAESEGYEKIDMDAIEKYDRLRALFWGAGGFVTGLIGEKEGRVPSATVQLRMLVQDARTGEVIWLNRAETCALPRTVYADPNADDLFSKAIKTTVNSLVKDFADAYASDSLARAQGRKSACEDEGAKIESESFGSEDAADKAERSAEEAKESAEQAKEAAAEAKDAVKKASEATKKSEKIFEKIITK